MNEFQHTHSVLQKAQDLYLAALRDRAALPCADVAHRNPVHSLVQACERLEVCQPAYAAVIRSTLQLVMALGTDTYEPHLLDAVTGAPTTVMSPVTQADLEILWGQIAVLIKGKASAKMPVLFRCADHLMALLDGPAPLALRLPVRGELDFQEGTMVGKAAAALLRTDRLADDTFDRFKFIVLAAYHR